MRSSSKCRVIGASAAILARRSKQANLHDSSMQTNAARSRRNPPGRDKFAMNALEEPLLLFVIIFQAKCGEPAAAGLAFVLNCV